MRRYRVEEARHDGAEDDVAVEVASLRDCSRDNCGTSGGEGALNYKYVRVYIKLCIRYADMISILANAAIGQVMDILGILARFPKFGILDKQSLQKGYVD